MGAVFSMCPHLFLYPVFCILAGNLLASGHKKEFGLSPDIPNPRLFLTNLLSTIHYFSVCKITSFFLYNKFFQKNNNVNVCVFERNCYLCKEFTNFAVGKTKYAKFVDTKMYVYKA